MQSDHGIQLDHRLLDGGRCSRDTINGTEGCRGRRIHRLGTVVHDAALLNAGAEGALQDACGIHGGEWSKGGKDCECVEGGNGWDGRYCLRPPGNDTVTSSSCSVGYVKDSNWLAFFVVVCIAIAVTLQRRKRLIPREKREDEIEMEALMERKR